MECRNDLHDKKRSSQLSGFSNRNVHGILSLRIIPHGLTLLPFHRRHPSAASDAHGSVVAHIGADHSPPRMMRFAEVLLDNAACVFDAHAEGAALVFWACTAVEATIADSVLSAERIVSLGSLADDDWELGADVLDRCQNRREHGAGGAPRVSCSFSRRDRRAVAIPGSNSDLIFRAMAAKCQARGW